MERNSANMAYHVPLPTLHVTFTNLDLYNLYHHERNQHNVASLLRLWPIILRGMATHCDTGGYGL